MADTMVDSVMEDLRVSRTIIGGLQGKLANARSVQRSLWVLSAVLSMFLLAVLIIAQVQIASIAEERDDSMLAAKEAKAELAECREHCGIMAAALDKCPACPTPHDRIVQRCCGSTCEDVYEGILGEVDQCEGNLKYALEHPVCPPAPTCNEEPINDCRRELNYREQKVDFGEWLVKMQEMADKKITALRDQYFTLLEQFQPLVAKAEEMGLGPRARDWITKPGAVELYLELGDRWTEIELIYNQMRGVIQEADSIAQRTCYQNIVWSWGEILPDERDHDKLQQVVYGLTNGDYFVYLYELQRAERNRED